MNDQPVASPAPPPAAPTRDVWAGPAVVASAIAALVGFVSAIASSWSAYYQHQAVEIETQPTAYVTCRQHIPHLDQVVAKDTYFLGTGSWPEPFNLTTKIPTYDQNGFAIELPPTYVHCEVIDIGRTPLADVHLDFQQQTVLHGFDGQWAPLPDFPLVIPYIQANGGEYEVNLANGSALAVVVMLQRNATAVIIRPGASPTAEPLALVIDDSEFESDQMFLQPAPRRLVFPSPSSQPVTPPKRTLPK